MKFFGFLILIFVFLNCGGTRKFQTNSIYRAPISAVQIEVKSSGFIESGADISNNSESQIKISSLNNNLPELVLELKRLSKSEEIRLNGVLQNSNLSSIIVHNLKLLSYPVPNTNELNEIVSVIYGTSAGPKGTLLKNQTKFLEVVSVEYKYQ